MANKIHFSDLDIDIPSLESNKIKDGLVTATIRNKNNTLQPHPAGVYLYKNVPSFDNKAILDYKNMEEKGYQKVDILNNSFLDGIDYDMFVDYLIMIEEENIEWSKLWEFKDPYQLSNYPFILKDFKVRSVLDVAIVLALIRPGAVNKFNEMKKVFHTNILTKKLNLENREILKETYGIPVFSEQFKSLGINKIEYTYKKPHALGYAYVLLLDFLKKTYEK